MQLFNNTERFGLLTKIFHWSIFLLFLTQYFLVYRREYFPKDAPEKLQYILLHKSLGVVILTIALLMIVTRHIGKRPHVPVQMPKAQIILARVMHGLLYLSMLVMPISGIAMSQYSGRAVSVFGLFDLPRLVAENKDIAGVFHEVHEISSIIIIVLVSGHAIAALYHHFFNKDAVLKRMLWG